MSDSYYLQDKPRLLKDFDKFMGTAQSVLSNRFSEDELDKITKFVRARFEGLIPEIPYVGGKDNQFSEEIESSAMSLALYLVLKDKGWSTEEIGKLNYHIYESIYRKIPGFMLSFMKRFVFTRFSKGKLRKAAERSQLKEYPDDWVIEYLDGTGQDFDIGLDFTQCAICRFYERQGAFEFAKYICLVDFIPAQMINSGLERSTTIAEGAERCDFRYKKGRTVRTGWPPPY